VMIRGYRSVLSRGLRGDKRECMSVISRGLTGDE
jgi:hypothetical protein